MRPSTEIIFDFEPPVGYLTCMAWTESAVAVYKSETFRSQGVMDIQVPFTQEGTSVLRGVSELIRMAQKLQIYQHVDLDAVLPEEIQQEDEPGLPVASASDPRFAPSESAQDLRATIMTFVDPSIEPQQAAFALAAVDGDLDQIPFSDAVRTVKDANFLRWWELDDDREDAYEMAKLVYRAGQLELRKRNAS